MTIIIFIISIILAAIIVGVLRSLFMGLMGFKIMFVSGKSQIVTIFVLALFLASEISSFFGIRL